MASPGTQANRRLWMHFLVQVGVDQRQFDHHVLSSSCYCTKHGSPSPCELSIYQSPWFSLWWSAFWMVGQHTLDKRGVHCTCLCAHMDHQVTGEYSLKMHQFY